MVFLKSLASLGIGGTTVDTRLEEDHFHPGDLVKGEVHVRGGNSDQQIDDIYLFLYVEFSKGEKKEPYLFKKYQLAESFVIQPNELKVIPFQFKLPMELPMSSGSYPIYFKTGLDIKMAVDPTDKDRIEVLPIPLVQKLLKQVEDAGFILYKIVNHHDPDQKPHPFFQMFQFRPTGRYHGYVDELNVVFNVTDADISMDIEMIRSARILNSSFYWQYENPSDTLHLNNTKIHGDPILKIQEMLNKKTLH